MRRWAWAWFIGAVLLAGPICAQDNSVSVLAGSVASTSGENSGITIGFLHTGFIARLADCDMCPRLGGDVDLSAIPGKEITFRDPGTFRTVEAKFWLSQRPYESVRFSLFIEGGAAIVLSREQGTAMKWADFGIRIDRARGSLAIGIGADQRLGGLYTPAVIVYGGVQIHKQFGIGVWLVGQASVGLVEYGRDTPHDLFRLGIGLGR